MVIIPKLGLDKLRDSELDDYAKDKQDKITDSGNFPGVDPSVPDVMNKVEDYRDALSAAAQGSRSDTEAKNNLRKELSEMLTQQAYSCATIAHGDLALYLTSGYEAKDTHGHAVGDLERVEQIKVSPTDNEGELAVSWSSVPNARNYELVAFTDVHDREGTKLFSDVVGRNKFTLQGLPGGEQVYVQVRANGGSTGHGAWSVTEWARPR